MRADTNYIYILFAVAYVIYSIIKASKKAQQKSATQNQKPLPSSTVQPPTASPLPKQKPEDDFKKMLEDLLGGNPEVEIPEKQIPIPKQQPVTVKQQPAKIAPRHPKKEKLVTQVAKPITSKKSLTAESAHFISDPEIIQKAFQDIAVEEETAIDFDIQQAVIYSEILKRPHY